YTFTDAKQNRDINEHYAFDEEWISAYPWITSNAAARHRLVMTGSYALPWDMIGAAKLTFSTPIPHNDIECYNTAGTAFPQGGQCSPVAYIPNGMGIRTVDLQLTKNFQIRDAATVYVRIDVLNVFDTKSLVDYINSYGANGLITGSSYNPTGNIT